jgi:hypothetical protein
VEISELGNAIRDGTMDEHVGQYQPCYRCWLLVP